MISFKAGDAVIWNDRGNYPIRAVVIYATPHRARIRTVIGCVRSVPIIANTLEMDDGRVLPEPRSRVLCESQNNFNIGDSVRYRYGIQGAHYDAVVIGYTTKRVRIKINSSLPLWGGNELVVSTTRLEKTK